MSNPYNNEVIFNGQTLMSLKEDTVTPDKVLAGETFHDRSGAPQTGNLITHNVYDGLDSTSTSDALSANQGRELNSKISNILKYVDVAITNAGSAYFDLGVPPTTDHIVFRVSMLNTSGVPSPWTQIVWNHRPTDGRLAGYFTNLENGNYVSRKGETYTIRVYYI